jgi:hypothetical protein
MDKNTFAVVHGFPRYEVNKNGVLRNRQTGKILSTHLNKKGYVVCDLYTEPHVKTSRTIHRVLMTTFCPVPDMENLQVNHKDGVKTNNSLDNLEWCTNQENMTHGIALGLFDSRLKSIDVYDAITGEFVNTFKGISDASRELCVSRKEFDASRPHMTKTRVKYIWRYVGEEPPPVTELIRIAVVTINDTPIGWVHLLKPFMAECGVNYKSLTGQVASGYKYRKCLSFYRGYYPNLPKGVEQLTVEKFKEAFTKLFK